MARKIVRDIERKNNSTVCIEDGALRKIQKNKKNTIDLSSLGKNKFVLTGQKNDDLKDLSYGNPHTKAKEQVYFIQEAEKEQQVNHQIFEIIKMFAAGAFILLIVNLFNIYKHGVVIKDNVIATAFSGYEDLLKAGKQAGDADFNGAETSFNQATQSFNSALQVVSFLQTNQDFFFTKEQTVDSINGLLEGAKSLALAGKDFSRGIENLKQLPDLLVKFNQIQSAQKPSQSLTQKLKEDLSFIEKAAIEVESAKNNFAKVSPEILPEPMKAKLVYVKEKIANLLNILKSVQKFIPALLDLLGDRYPHRYLILLQNDAESRPTGGFIGSYILADFNDGYLTKMEFHDVYDSDGQLQEEIPAPEDIASITKNWRMRDSNYSPDFTISAEKAAWFLQKEKGPSVDTIIAVNQSFLADLLQITGPVHLDNLEADLDYKNYQLVLSYIIENKLSGAENPKKILGDFIEKFQQKLFTESNLEKVLLTFVKGYQNKKLLFYSRYNNIQEIFDDLGMSSRTTKNTLPADYLSVINTNIGGNKSDLFMTQKIDHYSFISKNGTVRNELTITRKHNFSDQVLELWKKRLRYFGFKDLPDHIADILGRGKNKSSIKVYVPKGSKLVDAFLLDKDKIAIRTDDEIDKSYFMFQMETAAGEEQKVTLVYDLPYSLKFTPVDTYRINLQKQASVNDSELTRKIIFAAGQQSYRQYPQTLQKDQSGNLFYDGKFDKDLYFSTLAGS